jgi:flagellar biosynthetic protein FlhB
MAEDSSEEKEFDPTPRRLQKAREEGRVAVSKDVMSAAQLITGLLVFSFLGPSMLEWMLHGTRDALIQLKDGGGEHFPLYERFSELIFNVFLPFTAVGSIYLVIAGVSGVLQTGFNWAPKALELKLERINPGKRFGELFGFKKLAMNTLLSTTKILVAALVVWLIISGSMSQMTVLSFGSLNGALLLFGEQLIQMFLWISLVLTALAVVDYVWQRHQMMESLKMTREEMKRERIEEEGTPEIKGRRRQMHRELSLNRILEEVPNADVIVTNPTHFAVALRYRPGADRAPMVTAKGVDTLAAHIRSVARRNGVPIIENRPLARSLWRKVRIGRAVPANLYQAVAEVLARVYRARSSATTRTAPRASTSGARS